MHRLWLHFSELGEAERLQSVMHFSFERMLEQYQMTK